MRAIDDTLMARGGIAVVVGQHGSGKTTLARSFVRDRRCHWMVASPERMAVSARIGWCIQTIKTVAWSDRSVIVIDGVDDAVAGFGWTLRLINAMIRFKAILSGGRSGGDRSILVLAHRPVAGLSVAWHCAVDPQRVLEWVDQMTDSMSPPVRTLSRAYAKQRLTEQPGLNIRDLFFELYDLVQPKLDRSPRRSPFAPPPDRRTPHSSNPSSESASCLV